MNTSKTLLLLLALSAGTVNAAKESYYVDAGRLTSTSKVGAAFDKRIASLRSEVQTLALNEQSKITASEKDLTEKFQKGELTNQKVIAAKSAELEAQKRQANFKIEEKNRVITAKIDAERMSLSEKIMKEVGAVAEEKGWAALNPVTIFVAKEFDKTDEVLEAINKNYDADLARASLSSVKAA
jgi:Skp family chaperone for outer membrane proteins